MDFFLIKDILFLSSSVRNHLLLFNILLLYDPSNFLLLTDSYSSLYYRILIVSCYFYNSLTIHDHLINFFFLTQCEICLLFKYALILSFLVCALLMFYLLFNSKLSFYMFSKSMFVSTVSCMVPLCKIK